jgi:hypothetical protein
MYSYSVGALLIPFSKWVGGIIVMYDVEFRKESLSGSLPMSSMVHVEGIFFLGRRGREKGNVGSDLGFLFTGR